MPSTVEFNFFRNKSKKYLLKLKFRKRNHRVVKVKTIVGQVQETQCTYETSKNLREFPNKSQDKQNKVKLIHWNCNGIGNKVEELKLFIKKEWPDIICLNEIKQNEFTANYNLNIEHYETLFKVRVDKVGGGVAMIIKNTLDFEQISGLDHFESEIIGIKLTKDENIFHIYSYYNPPGKTLNLELLRKIEETQHNYMICGDLNAKSETILNSINQENNNGKLLEEFIINSNAIVLNNAQPTFHIKNRNYHEILDLVISSPRIGSMSNFKVFESEFLDSDHSPVEVIIDLVVDRVEVLERPQNRLNFSRTDWELFKNKLDMFELEREMKSSANDINSYAFDISRHLGGIV